LSGRLLIHDQEEVGWPEKTFISVLTKPGGNAPEASRKKPAIAWSKTKQAGFRTGLLKGAGLKPDLLSIVAVSGAGLDRINHAAM